MFFKFQKYLNTLVFILIGVILCDCRPQDSINNDVESLDNDKNTELSPNETTQRPRFDSPKVGSIVGDIDVQSTFVVVQRPAKKRK